MSRKLPLLENNPVPLARTLHSFADAIQNRITTLGTVEVIERFHPESLARFSMRAPAVCLSMVAITNPIDMGDGSQVLPCKIAMWVVTKSAVEAFDLVALLVSLVNEQRWTESVSDAHIPYVEARNLANKVTEKQRLSLWVVYFSHPLIVPRLPEGPIEIIVQFNPDHDDATAVQVWPEPESSDV